ncbi:MAG: glycosyltransferase [Bacteroidetes bacterium]|jgi:glycosyltransferase involved in cell wall biosynthesis|nr:glycosyltransferase [Bacteroidota bacterium]
MSITLITTVLNEGSTIDRFLGSVLRQTRLPDELVIVDGGSQDGTIERIRLWQQRPGGGRIKLIVDPSCSRAATPGPIGRGRNVAIRAASNDLIACADAGCAVEPTWLDAITRPFEDPSVTVAGGWYLPGGTNTTQRALSLFWIVTPEELVEDHFIPSSRSVAFRRSAWAEVGGYPENSLSSEDTMFIMHLRSKGHRILLVRDALVNWELPPTARRFARLVFRYGFGDGFNRILARNVLGTFASLTLACLLVAAGVFIHWGWSVAMPFVMGSYAARRRWRSVLRPRNVALLPLMGLLRPVSDISYLVGYVRGRATRRHPVIPQIV